MPARSRSRRHIGAHEQRLQFALRRGHANSQPVKRRGQAQAKQALWERRGADQRSGGAIHFTFPGDEAVASRRPRRRHLIPPPPMRVLHLTELARRPCAQPDDGARYAGLRPDPLIPQSGEGDATSGLLLHQSGLDVPLRGPAPQHDDPQQHHGNTGRASPCSDPDRQI